MKQFSPPSLVLTVTEIWRAFIDLTILLLSGKLADLTTQGDGRPIIVIPGFGADGSSTKLLRNYLNNIGYNTQCWGQGRNLGVREESMIGIADLINETYEKTGQKITLIGQSLGGIYARELAKLFPEKISQVITLGSPFNDTNGDSSRIAAIYKILNPNFESTTVFGEMILNNLPTPPVVPTTAIYSKLDGVVNWKACLQYGEHERVTNVEVSGSHCGMAMNSQVYSIITDKLTQCPQSV